MRPAELNALVKSLNAATERPEVQATQAATVATLRQRAGERPLTAAERQQLQALRQEGVQLEARQAEVARLNANPNFADVVFAVVGGRITVRQRTPQELLRHARALARTAETR